MGISQAIIKIQTDEVSCLLKSVELGSNAINKVIK